MRLREDFSKGMFPWKEIFKLTKLEKQKKYVSAKITFFQNLRMLEYLIFHIFSIKNISNIFHKKYFKYFP